MRIDAHQHFWQYDPQRHAWINDDMLAIQKDFLPHDLQPLLQHEHLDGCVHVQVDQTEAETDWMLSLAHQHDFIKGIVGWVDLQAANITERLSHYATFPSIKGFRHIVQGESDLQFLLRPDFLRGIRALEAHHFTYDILVYPQHLPVVREFVAKFPYQPFVIDHLAKPFIRTGEIDTWQADIKAIAEHENVLCKLSGMVTEADWQQWKPKDMRPYIQTVLDAFGPGRLLYGSDWPVCLVAATYHKQFKLVEDFISKFSDTERNAIMGDNACRFYNL